MELGVRAFRVEAQSGHGPRHYALRTIPLTVPQASTRKHKTLKPTTEALHRKSPFLPAYLLFVPLLLDSLSLALALSSY